MTAKFRNKYRGQSTRLQRWNYGWDAAYFITICTKGREWYFGHCQNGIMILNDVGKIVESEWLKTFEMRSDMNLSMGEYVVMPNHFHAILGIGLNKYNCRDSMHCAPTIETSPAEPNPPQNRFGPQSKNLASIIRGFKSGVTVRARPVNPNFAWQPLFYDHIIRNDNSFQRITEYIRNNPGNWKEDKFRL